MTDFKCLFWVSFVKMLLKFVIFTQRANGPTSTKYD